MATDDLTHASFFSGVGGLDLGLERAGWRTVSFSEIDPYASAVLAERWPSVPNLGDITDLAGGRAIAGRGELLRQHAVDRATLWSGGFPCQDLSVAGKRAGFAGERSSLAFAFLDLVERHRPPAILLENVPGLLSSHGGRDFGRLLGEMGQLGYGWAYRILDARHFGVPQRRRRVFIVGLHAGTGLGADRAAAVLSVGTRCDRHPATGHATGTGAADTARIGLDIAGGLTRRYGKGVNTTADDGGIVIDGPSPDPGGNGTPHGVARRMDHRQGLEGQEVDAELEHGALARTEAEATWTLRELREAEGRGTSRQRRLARQLAGELEAALSQLPQLGASAAEALRGLRGAAEGAGLLQQAPDPSQEVGQSLRDQDEPEHAGPILAGGNGWQRTTDLNTPLVYTKRARVSTPGSPESWKEGGVMPTLNSFDVGDTRTTGIILGEGPQDDPLLPLGLDSHRYRCCGNGVVSSVSEWIGLRLAATFEERRSEVMA